MKKLLIAALTSIRSHPLATIGALLLIALLLRLSSTGPQFFPYGKDTEFSRKGWYPKHLKAMREPSLYEHRAQAGTEFRFLHLPTFHNPSAIRITRTATGAELRMIRLSGAGGYEPGKIKLKRTRQLDDSQWKHFMMLLDKASFWRSPEEENGPLMCDGSRWILEGRADGQYHLLDRQSPKGRSHKTEAFVTCCMYLWGLAALPEDEKLY